MLVRGLWPLRGTVCTIPEELNLAPEENIKNDGKKQCKKKNEPYKTFMETLSLSLPLHLKHP